MVILNTKQQIRYTPLRTGAPEKVIFSSQVSTHVVLLIQGNLYKLQTDLESWKATRGQKSSPLPTPWVHKHCSQQTPQQEDNQAD